VDITVPITVAPERIANAGAWWFDAVGRIKAGTTVEQARIQADTVFQTFMKDREASEMRTKHFDHIELASAARGLERLRTRFSRPLYALTVVAALVLLIACANLGNLLLVRGAARGREFAIRLATGAGAGRLFRQLVTETLLLFLVGAAAGLAVAQAAIGVLTGFFAIGRNPIALDVRFDWRLAVFAASIALGAGLMTGLWPAVRALNTDPHGSMKEGEGRLAGSRRFRTTGRLLLVSQVALSLVLMVTAVLFVRSMLNLRAVDLGFVADRVLTMSLDPIIPGDGAGSARQQFWVQALERVRALPGVRAASLSVLTPLSGRDTGKIVDVPGFQPRSQLDKTVRLNHVSEDYFRVFGIRLIAGREFTANDTSRSRKVAIVNEAAAGAFFSGRSVIGGTLDFGNGNAYEVIGVVENFKHQSVREQAPRFAFVPLWQRLDGIGRITLAVSSDQPAASMTRAVTREVTGVNVNTLLSDVISVNEQIDATLVSERLLSTLATWFAALALGLAAVGLYGILSYWVARRRTEFGVRLALGAPVSSVVWVVLRQVLAQVGLGLAIGLPAAIAVARASEALLFGISPMDLRIYALSAAALVAVAGLAAWLPARRASSIDPCEALRQD
jgi:predicted permease